MEFSAVIGCPIVYITIRSKAEFLVIKKYPERVFMFLIIIFISLIILGVYITLWIVARKHPDSTIGKFFSRLQEAMEEHYIKKREEKEKIRADYENRKAQKKEFKAKHPWFCMFKNVLGWLLCISLIFVLPLCAYKKFALDYTGTYAKDRFIYDSDEGLCMLVTYYPEYRTGEEKGFALAHLPVTALGFPLESGIDKRKGNDIADSKEILDSFQTKSTWGGSGLLSILSLLLGAESGSSNSFDIGKHGKYFIIDGRKSGL